MRLRQAHGTGQLGVNPPPVLLCTPKHYPQTPLVWSLAYLPFPVLVSGRCSVPARGSWTQPDPALPGTSHAPSFQTGLWCWMGPRSPGIIKHLILFLSILAALAIPCPLLHPGFL